MGKIFPTSGKALGIRSPKAECNITRTYISLENGVLIDGQGSRNASLPKTRLITSSLDNSLYGNSAHSSSSHSKTP